MRFGWLCHQKIWNLQDARKKIKVFCFHTLQDKPKAKTAGSLKNAIAQHTLFCAIVFLINMLSICLSF
jgi:hypothetical protein